MSFHERVGNAARRVDYSIANLGLAVMALGGGIIGLAERPLIGSGFAAVGVVATASGVWRGRRSEIVEPDDRHEANAVVPAPRQDNGAAPQTTNAAAPPSAQPELQNTAPLR